MEHALWRERLDELALLEDGWHDGDDGLKIPQEVIELVEEFLSRLENEGQTIPSIFPMLTEDGMSMVWYLSSQTITLRVYSVNELELSRFNFESQAPKRIFGHQAVTVETVDALMEAFREWSD